MEKMSVGFVNTDHDSPILLPPDLRDWISAAQHDTWSLDLLLRQCDLSRFLGGGAANGLGSAAIAFRSFQLRYLRLLRSEWMMQH